MGGDVTVHIFDGPRYRHRDWNECGGHRVGYHGYDRDNGYHGFDRDKGDKGDTVNFDSGDVDLGYLYRHGGDNVHK